MPRRRQFQVRAFIAIPILPEVKQRLAGLQSKLLDVLPAGSVRPENRKNFHITLRFLGNIEEEEIERVNRAARRTVEGVPSDVISIDRLGAFPSPARPRVFWAGFSHGVHGSTERLAKNLSRYLKKAGYPPEKRRFSPHVTLARVKSKLPSDSGRAAVELPVPGDLEISVDRIVLIESILSPNGAIHKELVTFNLAI